MDGSWYVPPPILWSFVWLDSSSVSFWLLIKTCWALGAAPGLCFVGDGIRLFSGMSSMSPPLLELGFAVPVWSLVPPSIGISCFKALDLVITVWSVLFIFATTFTLFTTVVEFDKGNFDADEVPEHENQFCIKNLKYITTNTHIHTLKFYF